MLLVGWVAVSGKAGQLVAPRREQWRWILLTGLLLTAYVATWYAALARAQAVDVTAVLVFGAVVTALLSGAADGTPINATGTILVAAGVGARRRLRASPAVVEADRFVTETAGAASLRALRVSAERARPLRRRQRLARCSSTATPTPPTVDSPSSRGRSTAPGRT